MKNQRLQLALFFGLALLIGSCAEWKLSPRPYILDGPIPVLYCGALNGNVYALNANTGDKFWQFATGQPINSSLYYDDGVIYVINQAGQVYALDADVGTPIWVFSTRNNDKDNTGNSYSSPVVANRVLYVGSTNDTLYALDVANGQKKWGFVTRGPIRSSPAIKDGMIYFGSDDFTFYAVDAQTGKGIWSYRTQGKVWSSPAISADGGSVYVGSGKMNDNTDGDKKLYAFDKLTGTNPRSFSTGGAVDSSPFVQNGKVYVGSRDSYVYALDANTLTLPTDTSHYYAGSPIFSSPVVYKDTLYIGNDSGRIFALNAKELGPTNIREFPKKGSVSSFSSSPVLANGVLYIGGGNSNFYALDVATGTPRWTFSDQISDGFHRSDNVYVSGAAVVVQGRKVIGTYPSISGHVN